MVDKRKRIETTSKIDGEEVEGLAKDRKGITPVKGVSAKGRY